MDDVDVPPARVSRFLIKSKGGIGLAEGSLSLAGVKLHVEPLFESGTRADTLGLAGDGQWLLATAETVEEENPWEAAHRAASDSAGLRFGASGAEAYIEPDLLQTFPYTLDHARSPGLGATGDCAVKPADPAWPTRTEFGWHLGDAHSQLKAARDAVGDLPADGRRIRIGILDSGYDPQHRARPDHILTALERSFIDGDGRRDAHDPGRDGLGRNPGHGTATIALLAGRRLQGMSTPAQSTNDFLGGAPFAEILPLRVANSVVQMYSSALARGLEYALRNGCDVISMSLGGLPSRAWAEIVNRCYEAGVVIVAAAGNNVRLAPVGPRSPSSIVWPARFRRVIAATGIVADYGPYWRSGNHGSMQGNFGPASAMATALAAYTPNAPWAKLGCSGALDYSGAGTSSATPQVAAAAALWLQKHRPSFPGEPWKQVEAVRRALFGSAKRDLQERERFFGRGALRALDALAMNADGDFTRTPADSVSFPILRVITGMPLAAPSRLEMFELEALQLTQRHPELEAILRDPDDPGSVTRDQQREFIGALIEAEDVSRPLREFLETYRGYVRPSTVSVAPVPKAPVASAEPIAIPAPSSRKLRGYAFDPSLSTRLDVAVINQLTYHVPWEDLTKGPIGEYLEIIDYDPASGCYYDPVDLNDPHLLAQEGLAPSEGNPQFHQQMVYAVAMTTIRNFERALGRKILWAPHWVLDKEGRITGEENVPRLRIYPHALREANAYYSPDKKALLFGYFPADDSDPAGHYPGGMVFTCLSHDIIAHEVTHALLDGLHQRFTERSNPDVAAFHEAFADIVALLQHFTFPSVLEHQIARTRGDLEQQNLLGQLAQQFGRAIGGRGALRDAIGRVNPKTGEWEPIRPDPQDYQRIMEPHRRGAILVAAIFDAFLSIYKTRVADLLRIATQGSGVLPPGELHPDLVRRLSDGAAKTASHVLRMCIRALDYCPTVDITFGDYLRALITADHDLVPEDELGYRIAIIEGFRRRGIYPLDLRALSVDTLVWEPMTYRAEMSPVTDLLREFLGEYSYAAGREARYRVMKKFRARLQRLLVDPKLDLAIQLGLDLALPIEVHALRPAQRVTPDGDTVPQIVVEIAQQRRLEVANNQPMTFRGGCTLIVDVNADEKSLGSLKLRYCIQKRIDAPGRLNRQVGFTRHGLHSGLRETYFGPSPAEPFAILHRSGALEEP